MVRVKPEIRSAGLAQALDAEAGADQQHERERDLADHQQAAQAVVGRRQARAASALLQRRVEIGPRGLQRRREPEDQAGGEGDQEGEPEGAGVDADRDPDGQIGMRHPSHQQVDRPIGDQHSKAPARAGQQQAFGEQLPDQPAAAGAHGESDGDFLLPAGGPGQEQVRHVGRHDQQHADADRQQDGQDSPENRLGAVGSLR